MRGFLLVVFDGRGELVMQEGELIMASSSDIMKKQK